MKISYNWLKEYIRTDASPETLSALLTGTGLEVESLERVQSVPGGLEGLVIGKVVARWQHPNADRLSLTRVDAGGGELLQVVCGAPNVEEGQKVVLAPVGVTVHPLSGAPFEIRKAKIRGEESSGMICAEDEIGLGESHNGILLLPEDAPVGVALKDYMGLTDDWVFEIGLTPNRADAASHIGVARDLAAVLKEKVLYPSVSGFREGAGAPPLGVRVENEEACIRYSGVIVEGIRVEESPRWLQDRLRSVGIKCINNVVDITNYVLHETGQPLHAFNLPAIRGGEVIVRTLPEGTPFVTLDGVERKLSGQDLMICDREGGMCIAGVFGGIHSGITADTASVFLESACFNPVYVRRTAKRHSLKTDASFRFERGTDPNITLYALRRAALLLCGIAGGKVSSPITDIYPREVKKAEIVLDFDRARRLIGKEVPAAEIRSILEGLEIGILGEDAKGMKLAIPTNKVDVTREVDVIEEILRIYGYDNVEMPAKVNASLSYSAKPDAAALRNTLSDFLSANGFFEIMTNSLGASAHAGLVEELDAAGQVQLLNPLSSELDVLRQSMLFSGLQSVAYNLNRRNTDLKLYEFGKVYRKVRDGYREDRQLALFVCGRKSPESWNADSSKADIFYLKGFVEAILRKLGVRPDSLVPCGDSDLDRGFRLQPGERQLLRAGEVAGRVRSAFDIETPVYYAEFDWDYLLELRKGHSVVYREVPKFPAVRRDLSLLLDAGMSFQQLEETARRAERKILKEVSIFDKYVPGKGQESKIPAGKKSYALSFILMDEEGTLTDERIEQAMQRLISAFEKEGAEIRK